MLCDGRHCRCFLFLTFLLFLSLQLLLLLSMLLILPRLFFLLFFDPFFFLSFSCDRTDPHVCSNLRPDAVPIGNADFQTNAAADTRADTASDVAAHPRAYCFTDLCAYGWAHALPELSPDTTAYGRTVARSFTPADS